MDTILHPTRHQDDIDAFNNEAVDRPRTGRRTGYQTRWSDQILRNSTE